MTSVQIVQAILKASGRKVVLLKSPYNPDLPGPARELGGKWDGESWVFDARDEEAVAELARAVYGTDGRSPSIDTVTLLVKADDLDHRNASKSLWFAGRQVVYVTGRDSGARLADGIIVRSGKFKSGGSMKNYQVVYAADTIVEIRDLPHSVAVDTALDAGTAELVDIPAPEAIPTAVDHILEQIFALSDEDQLKLKARLS